MKKEISQLTKKMMFVVLGSLFFINSARAMDSSSCPFEKAANGKKSTSEIVVELKSIMKDKNCTELGKLCEIRGEGEVGGAWKKHRIFLNESAIAGANDLDSLMENVNELRSSGVCTE